MLASFIAIFALSEAGFQLGFRRERAREGKDPSWLLEGTAFSLLALLVGFSFSMALGRYDARRNTFLREANAIATTFTRAQLLDATAAAAIRADLRAYIEERLDFARADAAPQQRTTADRDSEALQRKMWVQAIRAARRDPHSTIIPLFVTALNDTINLSIEERTVLTNHIPDVVIVWLLAIALIAAGMMGYGYGKEKRRAAIFQAIFAAMIALVFGLILDLDRPQRGIIRVSLASMQRVQQMMNAASEEP